MHLKNFPKVRIQKYPKGYVVEAEFKKWYGKKYWKHIISVSGIDEIPWYFSRFEVALREAQKRFKWDLIDYSN